MTGICDVFMSFLMSLHKDTPSLWGIMISLITKSKSTSSINFSASTPSLACITWNSSDRDSAINTLRSSLSSVINIFFLFAGMNSLPISLISTGRASLSVISMIVSCVVSFCFMKSVSLKILLSSGKYTIMSVPFSRSLWMEIVPFCNNTKLFTSARPIPVPRWESAFTVFTL